MILYYDWPELPKMVRIKSDKLCLDYTYCPHSCFNNPASLKELVELANHELIDEVYADIPECCKAYCVINVDSATKEKTKIIGWYALSNFSKACYFT